MTRHAEIAGAGIAGLTLAAALGQRGWSVRVHEQASELRELGVGTTLWGNGLDALRRIGALDEALIGATAIHSIEVFDEANDVMRSVTMDPVAGASFVVLRTSLHRALVKAARSAGAEIITASTIVGATADGALVDIKGQAFAADLVVGADGYRSPVRDALGLADEAGSVTEAWIGRVALPARAHRASGTIREFWNGGRCCGVLTCGEHDYLFLSAPEGCLVNTAEMANSSLDRRTWIQAFPVLADYLPDDPPGVIWGRYPVVTCATWSRGVGVLLGDAAHAMPSTLAQGAGCAMTNALALAIVLEGESVQTALQSWERMQRGVTDLTQRWAILYLTILKRWPENLLPQRAAMIRDAFSHPGVANHFSSAAHHRIRAS